MSEAIGIDLGTTNSCIAICKDEQAEVVKCQGKSLTPSCVAFGDERVKIGQRAVKHKDARSKIYGVKRIIGLGYEDAEDIARRNKWQFCIENNNGVPEIQVQSEERRFRPEEISALVLDELYEITKTRLRNSKDASVVLAIPAHFTNDQRAATKEAAKIASIEVKCVISESTAAAIAYKVLKKHKKKRNILVFDLGGGTLDITIAEIKGKYIEVIEYAGDPHLGGEDFTRKFADEMEESILFDIRDKVEDMRNKLSSDNLARFDVNFTTEEINRRAEDITTELTTNTLFINLSWWDENVRCRIHNNVEKLREQLTPSNLERLDDNFREELRNTAEDLKRKLSSLNIERLDKNFREEIRKKAERVKIALSSRDMEMFCPREYNYSQNITRRNLDDINKETYDRVMAPLYKVLARSSVRKEDISDVLLVGGSVRVPYIRILLDEFFGEGKIRYNEEYCDQLVAKGTAILASHHSENGPTKIKGIYIKDVSPFYVGTKMDGIDGNRTRLVIPRNTKLPAKAKTVYKIDQCQDEEKIVTISLAENDDFSQIKSTNDVHIRINRMRNGKVKIKLKIEINESGMVNVFNKQNTERTWRKLATCPLYRENEVLENQKLTFRQIKNNRRTYNEALQRFENARSDLQRSIRRHRNHPRRAEIQRWIKDYETNPSGQNAVQEMNNLAREYNLRTNVLETLRNGSAANRATENAENRI